MNIKFFTIALFGLIVTLSSARADLINIEVKGGAALIDPALATYFDIGDEMTLRFNIDLDVIGFENSLFSSNIQLSPMAFSIAAYSGSVSRYSPSITNGPGCSYTCGDVWAAEAKNDFGTTFIFPMFGDYYLDIVQIEYRDDSGTALNTANMAKSIEQISNFSSWHLGLYFKDTSNLSAVRASILSFAPTVTISPVLEPTTLTIFALGLMGLASRRFKNNRSIVSLLASVHVS